MSQDSRPEGPNSTRDRGVWQTSHVHAMSAGLFYSDDALRGAVKSPVSTRNTSKLIFLLPFTIPKVRVGVPLGFLFGGFSSTAGYAFRQTRLTLQIPRDSQASGVSCTHYRLITSCTVSQVFILATEDQKSANKPSIEIQLRTCGTSLSASVPGVSDGGFRSCRLTKKSVTAILPPPGAGQNARKQP